jgi:hypothetical protein
MQFNPLTQEELQTLNIQEGNSYKVKYKNKDYFNGETTIEISEAKAIFNDGQILFSIPDPYGMEKFIKEVEIIFNS